MAIKEISVGGAQIDTGNMPINQAVLPLPYKEPSATLFQLLGFCIGAAEKFIGTTDLGMGESNQELPVGTWRVLPLNIRAGRR
jgi:hypothetical protein